MFDVPRGVLADFEFAARPASGRTWFAWLLASSKRPHSECGAINSAPSHRTPPAPTRCSSPTTPAPSSAAIWALGWPMPARVLDLFTEFRDRTNGLATPAGAGLLGALDLFGLDTIGAAEKEAMRELVCAAGRGRERAAPAILDYCESDVARARATAAGHAAAASICRAHCCAAATWPRRRAWSATACRSIPRCSARLRGTLDGHSGRADRRHRHRLRRVRRAHLQGRPVRRWLAANGIPWPRLDSGRLDLSDDTFRQMAQAYPAVAPLRELRSALSEMRLNDLAVGRDGRNRTILSAFRSRTGRNQPSNTKFIFGPSVWLRGLIQPPPGYGVAYIDWSQQEFGIAAALSGDRGDAGRLSLRRSLSGLRQAGRRRAGGRHQGRRTRPSASCSSSACWPSSTAWRRKPGAAHRPAADRRARSAAGPPRDLPRVLALVGRRRRPRHAARLDLHTVFGWHVHVGEQSNPRSLRNFPMQANGAEMLRLACCFATERGIEVCAPVHDAVLIARRSNGSKRTSRPCGPPWRKRPRRYWADSSSAPRR